MVILASYCEKEEVWGGEGEVGKGRWKSFLSYSQIIMVK
jgi:hypothetical protein